MHDMLKPDEIWDDLQCKGLGIIRNARGFAYGQDAVLLANYLCAKKSEAVLDMCAGGGIIAILAAAKTGASFVGVELQAELCDMARRSVERNAQADSVEIINGDIRTLHKTLGYGVFDAACCNPPYYPGGTVSQNTVKRLSIHQDECTMADVAQCAARMLKNGGRFYMVYPVSRMAESFHALVQNGIQPKKLVLVRAKRNEAPYLFMTEAKKGAGAGLIMQDMITIEEDA
ncbi:MAG: methyltransferase [Clostridia bacterium]